MGVINPAMAGVFCCFCSGGPDVMGFAKRWKKGMPAD